MKKIKYVFLSLSILLFAHSAPAQVLFVDTNNEFENFDYNVKQIDEFILRFNLKELLIQPEQSNSYERDNRTLLFDKDYYLGNSDNLKEFLTSIEEQKTVLSFYDSTWYAIAECNVTFQGKKDRITLFLQTEQVVDDIYKWSIVDAHGTLLDLVPKTKSDRIRLLPTDNEVNFIALQSATTTNAPNITLYSSKAHANDRLSVFNCLVYNKLLKIDNVQELTYCFTQVKGYKFYVRNFTRNQKNAGWLIFNVEKEMIKEAKSPSEENIISDSSEMISRFYQLLSEYAKDPSNVSLAKTIQSQFLKKTKDVFFFGSKNIYDDINVFSRKYSPQYAYVAISDYLNTLDNVSKSGIALSYKVDEFKVLESDDSRSIVTYKVSIYNAESIVYDYYAKAQIQNDCFVSIVHIMD